MTTLQRENVELRINNQCSHPSQLKALPSFQVGVSSALQVSHMGGTAHITHTNTTSLVFGPRNPFVVGIIDTPLPLSPPSPPLPPHLERHDTT